jgi:hypothetical protein
MYVCNVWQSVVERVEYRAAGPGQTVARRSAWIDSQVFGFSRAIRAFGVDRFRKNCNQMVSITTPYQNHNNIVSIVTIVYVCIFKTNLRILMQSFFK